MELFRRVIPVGELLQESPFVLVVYHHDGNHDVYQLDSLDDLAATIRQNIFNDIGEITSAILYSKSLDPQYLVDTLCTGNDHPVFQVSLKISADGFCVA
jgi:hypothetical protein